MFQGSGNPHFTEGKKKLFDQQDIAFS